MRPFPSLVPLRDPYFRKTNAHDVPQITHKYGLSGRILREMWDDKRRVDEDRGNLE